MSFPFRLSSRAWLIIPLMAAGFLIWTSRVRMQRVIETTSLVQEAVRPDANSPTGYADGTRQLVVPDHNSDSYQWIMQTQQMLAKGEWRVRHVDYDNAPYGRAVDAPSPYRWWLGLVAWLDHAFSGRPLGLSVERAALLADPILHFLLLASATMLVAWQFGCFPAALLSGGVAALFPLAAWFVPGAPDDRALSLACAVWSVLPLLVGVVGGPAAGGDPLAAQRRERRWFFAAGVVGGFGAWVSVAGEVPVVVGIFLGGLTSIFVGRKDGVAESWWAWAFGGAATVLAGCLLDYFPAYLGDWQLRVLHPLYGLAWLGLGAGLALVAAWRQRASRAPSARELVFGLLALGAVAALPIVMWKTKNAGFLAVQVSSFRLGKLAGSAVADNLWTLSLHDGVTREVWTTVLPGLLILPAGWMLFRGRTPAATKVAIAVAAGPVLVALGFALWHLGEWSLFDGVLLGLLVAATAAPGDAAASRLAPWIFGPCLAVVLAADVGELLPARGSENRTELTKPELVGLIERDLARWLAKHVGGDAPLILAPPNETTTLYFYGGLRGLGTPARENQDGISSAVRILSASTPEEAKELIDRRGITHLVVPSWDSYLDEYARIGMGQLEGTFLSRLHAWRLPPWLKPIPYQLPTIAGFEGQSVTILEVVEDQEDSALLSRLAEYFVEMGQLDLAANVAQALRRYPADLGALVARAQVEIARDDPAAFARTVESLQSRLAGGADRVMPWDRRANLAVVLARGKHTELAREQVRRCLTDIDEGKVRSLTTISLYRFQVLAKAFNLSIADQKLHQLARDLLPADLRSRLEP